MQKNLPLLSIVLALLVSLFWIDARLASAVDVNPDGRLIIIASDKSDAKNPNPPSTNTPGSTAPCSDDPGAPCKQHTPPVAGETATDGSPCTTGYACNSPNVQKCGYADAGTCMNIPKGAGKCLCNCVMP